MVYAPIFDVASLYKHTVMLTSPFHYDGSRNAVRLRMPVAPNPVKLAMSSLTDNFIVLHSHLNCEVFCHNPVLL